MTPIIILFITLALSSAAESGILEFFDNLRSAAYVPTPPEAPA